MSWINYDEITSFRSQAMNSMQGMKNQPLTFGGTLNNLSVRDGKLRIGGDAIISYGLHLDGNMNDFTGNNLTSFSSGTPVYDSTNKKFGASSLSFNGGGTGQLVHLADSGLWTFGTGDFYFDCWIRRTVVSTNYYIWGQVKNGFGVGDTSVYLTLDTNILNFNIASSGAFLATGGNVPMIDGAWHHVRCGRNGDNLILGFDGNIVGITNIAGRTIQESTQTFTLGGLNHPYYFFNGNIDEFVLVKGAPMNLTSYLVPDKEWVVSFNEVSGALVKTFNSVDLDRIAFKKRVPQNTIAKVHVLGDNITPFTTAPNNTVFGCHFDNTNTDFVGNQAPASNSGTFNSTHKVFGSHSIYYNGSNQHTSWANNGQFTVGSGGFYYDFWVKRMNLNAHNICGIGDTAVATSFGHGVMFSSNLLRLYVGIGSSIFNVDSTVAITDNMWHHVRCGRDGNTLRLFLDGKQQGSGTAITGAINAPTTAFSIGRIGITNNTYLYGYVDEFLFVKGSSVGNTNFTPPAKPYGSFSNITTDTLTLPTNVSQVDDYYNGDVIIVTSGVGTGQCRKIANYDDALKLITLDAPWSINPLSTDVLDIYDGVSLDVQQGYAPSQIEIDSNPKLTVMATLEKLPLATEKPSMSIPIIASIGNSVDVYSGSGTGALSAGQLTVNVILPTAVAVETSIPRCDVISTSATGYTMNATAQLVSPTNLQLKFSGSNATAPFGYVWHVEQCN